LWCHHLDRPYLIDKVWNDKVYTIKDYTNLRCLLEYGKDEPSYKPRKIFRTL
jgi:hypothetical protein